MACGGGARSRCGSRRSARLGGGCAQCRARPRANRDCAMSCKSFREDTDRLHTVLGVLGVLLVASPTSLGDGL
eukprot:3707963-Prymnesium_polylepis.1